MILRSLTVIVGVNLALFGFLSHAKAQDNNPFSGAREISVVMMKVETGIASWYGRESGTTTASGEHFNERGDTCAMRSYQRGERRTVTVTVLSTGKSARCRVNDHGPALKTGRLIDVSHNVAKKLDFVRAGTARVSVE